MAELNAPDLTGKVITVYLNVGSVLFPDQPGWTIEGPRFEMQAGRLFLTGVAVAADPVLGGWFEGAGVNVAWASVTHYLVYESPAAYREAMRRSGAARPGRGWFAKKGHP